MPSHVVHALIGCTLSPFQHLADGALRPAETGHRPDVRLVRGPAAQAAQHEPEEVHEGPPAAARGVRLRAVLRVHPRGRLGGAEGMDRPARHSRAGRQQRGHPQWEGVIPEPVEGESPGLRRTNKREDCINKLLLCKFVSCCILYYESLIGMGMTGNSLQM